jgi:hypothetical protein
MPQLAPADHAPREASANLQKFLLLFSKRSASFLKSHPQKP